MKNLRMDAIADGAAKNCPCCDCGSVAPVAVQVLRGREWWKITSAGVLNGRRQKNGARGVIVDRTFICEECGSQWTEREEFAKGSTYQCTYIQTTSPELDIMPIWRD